MLYYYWVNFVQKAYFDGERCNTRADRLNVFGAVNTRTEKVPLEELWRRGLIVTQEDISYPGDMFEAMRVDDYGHVTIWTRNRVWFMRLEGAEVIIEKLQCVDRNPSENEVSGGQ